MAKSNKLTLKGEFEKSAVGISQHYVVDLNDLKEAFSDRPESLVILNDALEAEKKSRKKNVIWGVVSLVVFWPVATIPAYLFYQHGKKINQIGEAVKGEIENNKAKALPPAGGTSGLPALPPPNLS